MASVPSTLSSPTRRPRRRGVAATSLVAVSTFGMLAGLTGTAQAATAVPLGGAEVYGVLGTTVTNTGTTTVAGDVGGTTRTGTGATGADSIVHTSGIDRGDIGDGQAGLTAAIADARRQGPATDVGTANLASSSPLGPGVYTSASDLALTGPLVLDGAGSYDSVFIFRAGESMTTASASTVTLMNGAQACNVFWEIDESATLGSGSTFRGTILAGTSITLDAGVTVDGRLLAGDSVTLISDTITRSGCQTGLVSPPTSTPVPTATPTGTPAPTATPTGTPAPTATPTGTTRRPTSYGQVGRVPVGSVDTGDGSTAQELSTTP
ncbi:ice-binding family protein [Modestobacter sp. VKM Ac-2977]|uniref:ice-binding family protein n=1 Tax=Modestobacter sp. VKM Ac-2977 TaxID=3004131 RepID=UPI0022AA6875|nr:ice-binding family protein [Modestobacter sp. VKM Ac-2977]MCZ2819558.1 ice-binding family protein [Modestobacter sp. VKM Ac-2977]